MKNCPENKSGDDGGVMDMKKFCYNCGKAGHSLSRCLEPLKDGGTKFAKCFICNESGHLSKDCSKNTHGVYPKGDSCKECGGITHLAKDCPNKANRNFNAFTGGFKRGISGGKTNLIKLASGDNLDDDFTTGGDTNDAEASVNYSTKSDVNTSVSLGSDLHTKPKKRDGPKVVNFFA